MLAKRAGVEPARVREAIRGGFCRVANPRDPWRTHDFVSRSGGEIIRRGWGDLDHSALIKLIEAGARSG